jgi:hypothetical protein
MTQACIYVVMIDGMDVTSRWMPLLQDLNITLTDSEEGDNCDIELDDRYSQLFFPPVGAELTVMLGWEGGMGVAPVFLGYIDDIRSIGSRGGGMTIRIDAKSVATLKKPKQQIEKHSDEEEFEKAAKELAKDSEIKTVKVAKKFSKIKRKYWSMQNESYINWGTRHAKELGANFAVNGDTASFTPRNGGESAGGMTMMPITVERYFNLINWDIAPVLGRPHYERTRARWFDFKAAKWNDQFVYVQDYGSKKDSGPVYTSKATQYDQDHAQNWAENDKEDSKRNGGDGQVEIAGNAFARPGSPCIVTMVRPGINGMYQITSVRHQLNRGSGWTTVLSIKTPGSDTGKQSQA